MLVTERLFIVHYTTWHSEENCEDSPLGGRMLLSYPLHKEIRQMLQERLLEADLGQCFRCPHIKVFLAFKIFSDPFYHSVAANWTF